jgi:hypothetical protein
MRPEEIPELPGYITVSALAERYDVDKGTIYYMLYNSQVFSRAYKIVKGVGDTKPLIMLDVNDATKVMDERRDRQAAKAVGPMNARNLREWNRRIKDWGIETGWTQTRISETGQPNMPLIKAYLESNPQDVRPG